jgi:hypothetical protein
LVVGACGVVLDTTSILAAREVRGTGRKAFSGGYFIWLS